MLTEIYVEALLIDEDLADQVWEAWDKGEIDGETMMLATADKCTLETCRLGCFTHDLDQPIPYPP